MELPDIIANPEDSEDSIQFNSEDRHDEEPIVHYQLDQSSPQHDTNEDSCGIFEDIVVSSNESHSDEDSICSEDSVSLSDYPDDDLRSELKIFLASENATLSFTRGLLGVLKKYHPSLPTDPRTLMESVPLSTNDFQSISPGSYYHFGLAKGLQFVLSNLCPRPAPVRLQLFVDGTPLFKSSISCFWPVLASIFGISNSTFIVGLYYGDRKPQDANDLLKDTITELKVLLNAG